ncbi:MAG: major facilitator superfamily 1 [Jatrophihabitantaceae bacterium]|nr:major facilitator superfamily 1 [Jatrophihabitantaceae bacterium]
MSQPPALDQHARRARFAVSALFLTNGAVMANLVPRYPDVKAGLGLSNAALGTAIAAFPLGALLAGLLGAALIGRFGSAAVATLGTVVMAGALVCVPLAGAWWILAAALLIVGALDSVVDVAQNAHGFRVQRRYGRSIVNAFHGLWSVGAVLGGLMGSVAAGLDIPLTAHLIASGALFGAVALGSRALLLPGPEDAERAESTSASAAARKQRPSRRTVPVLAALGLLAACGALIEDAGSSWGALYLRDDLAAGAAVGGLAFVSLQVAMTAGRLTGDRVVDRFGQGTVAFWGGVLIAAGMGLALAVPSIASTLAGFACAGLGAATLVPAVMHAADELPGLAAGVGLTVVSWLLRVGFLASAPVVGAVSDASSLRVALLGVVVAGGIVVALARVLGRAEHERAHP